MNVLHVYSDVREYTQWETQHFLASPELNRRYRPIHQKADDPYAYFAAFRAACMLGDRFLNVEQDIVPTVRILDELADCGRPACTVPYRLKHGPWSLFTFTGDAKVIRFDQEPGTQALGSGLGLVKIDPTVLTVDWASQPEVPYWELDQLISRGLRGYWHVHRRTIIHHRPLVD